MSSVDSTPTFKIQSANGADLLVADTTNMKITVANLEVTGVLTVADHIITGGSTPEIAAENTACSIETASINGNDTAGTITITTGPGCNAFGKLLEATFHNPYSAPPKVIITPVGADPSRLQAYIDNPNTTGFSLGTLIKPAINTTYRWSYCVVQ